MGSDSALKLDYLSLAEIAERPAAWWQNVLGVAAYDAVPPPSPSVEKIPMVGVHTPVLADGVRRYEVWQSTQAAQSGTRGGVRYRRSGGLLFGCVVLTENALSVPAGEASALQRATAFAYREIFATLDALAVPHLVRMWNFLPDINGESHGSERYWQFNSARQDGFIASGRAITGQVPAACGVGAAAGTPLVIYFLASTAAPKVIENPRQVSAYHYPQTYSPRSPTFSRACIADLPGGPLLFISGTASIVGHATVHVGDAAAQTRETLRNIEVLLEAANRQAGPGAALGMAELRFKAYVRNATDYASVVQELRAALGREPRALYLSAELCRRDLLVEIEAVGCHSSDSRA